MNRVDGQERCRARAITTAMHGRAPGAPMRRSNGYQLGDVCADLMRPDPQGLASRERGDLHRLLGHPDSHAVAVARRQHDQSSTPTNETVI
jgi:hypothetical protein